MVIGDTAGAGILPGIPHRVVRDGLNRHWVLGSGSTLPRVYSHDGRYIGEVGRTGDGPGEMREAADVIPVGDSVLVVHFRNKRASMFDHRLQWKRDIPWPEFWERGIRWPAANTMFFNGIKATRESMGLPLHLGRAAGDEVTIQQSLRMDDEELRPGELASQVIRMVRGPAGSVWTIRAPTYQLIEWSPAGERIQSLARTPLPRWLEDADGRHSPFGGRERRPDASLRAMAFDQAGRLWLYYSVASGEWKQAWPKRGSGELTPGSIANEKLFDTIVQVVDIVKKEIVAEARMDDYVIAAFSDGQVAVYDTTREGHPVLRIKQMDLRIR